MEYICTKTVTSANGHLFEEGKIYEGFQFNGPNGDGRVRMFANEKDSSVIFDTSLAKYFKTK